MTIKDALHKYAQVETRQFENRHKTVGGSEIGQCERKTWFARNISRPINSIISNMEAEFEAKAPAIDRWGAARRGTIFEEHFWVPAMQRHYGYDLLYSGKNQKTLISGNLSATPDGLLINQPYNALAGLYVPNIGPSGEIVVEAKTIDPRINLSEAKAEHVFQAQTQLGLFRELTKHKPDYALISYVNASFFDDIEEFVIKFDPNIYAHAKIRADKIIRAKNAEVLKPEGWIAGGSECRYCPFESECRAMRGAVPVDNYKIKPDPQFLAQLKDLAMSERKWNATYSDAKKEHRNVQCEIKELLKKKGLRRVAQPDLNIIWSTVKGKPSWDHAGLRTAAKDIGLDLSPYETVGEATDRLVVQVKPQDRLITNKKGGAPAKKKSKR